MTSNELFTLAKRYHPALRGHELQVTADTLAPYQCSEPVLNALYRYWQQDAPEAGPAYWSARCWTLLIWQPVYLTLVAVHGCRQELNLGGLYQYHLQGSVAGFSLINNEQTRHKTEKPIIQHAAQQLQRYYQWLLTECQRVFKLRSKLATRLTADTLLSGLIRLPVLQPVRDHKALQRLADDWLNALGWQGESRLIAIARENAPPILALNRKSCCFEYCRAGGELCSTCPKQPLATRLQRIKASYA